MFSLIITIISIALVTALALATIYYGGSAFKQGGDAAAAARLINEGQQLSGAAAVAGATNVAFTSIADLVTAKLLASAPQGWTQGTGEFSVAAGKAEVCQEVNKKASLGGTDGGATTAVVAGDVQNYGCTNADSTVHFKF